MTRRPTDERAPLLDRDAQTEAGETPVTQEKRTWWTIGWYTIFALLGLFVLGVFVKGIIDSDDVDVSPILALIPYAILPRRVLRADVLWAGWKPRPGAYNRSLICPHEYDPHVLLRAYDMTGRYTNRRDAETGRAIVHTVPLSTLHSISYMLLVIYAYLKTSK